MMHSMRARRWRRSASSAARRLRRCGSRREGCLPPPPARSQLTALIFRIWQVREAVEAQLALSARQQQQLAQRGRTITRLQLRLAAAGEQRAELDKRVAQLEGQLKWGKATMRVKRYRDMTVRSR